MFDINCKPLNINNWKVSSLSFADDLVLLSESRNGLINSLVKLENYCNEWGMKINPTKTKVLIFNKPFSKNIQKLTFTIDGEPIAVTNSYCYLGIEISNTGSFQKATDILYKKSLKSLFSLYSSLNIHSDEINVRLFLKLFEALVQPVLLYGCEVWGSHVPLRNNVIAKFTNKFYRTLLGVPSNCSTVGIHVELGRFPVDINIYKSMIKYWFRIVTLPNSRLVSHCYWSLLEINNLNDPWINTIQKIINLSGQYYIWNNQETLPVLDSKYIRKYISYIGQTLQDLFVQYATEKINSETKLHFFKNCKNSIKLSNYLLKLRGCKRRSLFCKLRLGTSDLEIEKGRKYGIAPLERYCKICPLNVVEDELHFVLNCPSLSQCRTNFSDKITKLNPSFQYMPQLDQIKYLYFNEDLPASQLEIAADLLICSEDTRKTLLSV